MAVAEKIVAEQLKALPDFRKWNNKGEIAFLPRILEPDEKILGLTAALYRDHKWLVTVTDKRIIFLRRKLMEGITDQLLMEGIESVKSETGFLFGRIIIGTRKGETLEINSVMKKDALLLTAMIEKEIISH
ncbi:MAG: PH domain-containing protein [Synergistales bacterium]|nr:PH domain-containing protein [Synergistales bacterium]